MFGDPPLDPFTRNNRVMLRLRRCRFSPIAFLVKTVYAISQMVLSSAAGAQCARNGSFGE